MSEIRDPSSQKALLITAVPLLSRGIAATLTSGPRHGVAVASDLPAARMLLADGSFDLVICDERAAATGSALELLHQDLTALPNCPPLIVLVDGYLSPGVRQLVRGAAENCMTLGIVDMSARTEELQRAVESVRANRSFVDSSLVADLLDRKGPTLTPREQSVFDHMMSGATNKDIAAALHLSPETIKTHVTKILRKLNAPTRMAAVLTAHRMGGGANGLPAEAPTLNRPS